MQTFAERLRVAIAKHEHWHREAAASIGVETDTLRAWLYRGTMPDSRVNLPAAERYIAEAMEVGS